MSASTAEKRKEHNDRYHARLTAARDVAVNLGERVDALEERTALLTDMLTKALAQSLSARDKERAA